MQELAFPETSKDPSGLFDDYRQSSAVQVRDGVNVVLFSRVDANGKHHYMVADRLRDDEGRWHLTNAKEFKHAHDRAHRYLDQRKADLAAGT